MSEPAAEFDSGPRLIRSRPLFCRVVELADPTSEVRILRLAITVGGAFRFAAGQYAMLTFGEQRPRAFSMASRPDEPLLEFYVRHGAAVGNGAGAHAAALLRPGDGVWVEGPYGEAFLRPRHQGPIIGVAGGTGVAPLLSIVATALAAGPGRDVALYVGAREEGDLYVAARLTRLAARHPGFRWIPVLSKPQASAARRTGLVTDALSADIAGGAALPLATAKAYIAGPPAMVTAAAALLQSAGIGVADIHADGLRPPPPADEPVWCDGSGAPTANEPFNRAR